MFKFAVPGIAYTSTGKYTTIALCYALWTNSVNKGLCPLVLTRRIRLEVGIRQALL